MLWADVLWADVLWADVLWADVLWADVLWRPSSRRRTRLAVNVRFVIQARAIEMVRRQGKMEG